MSWPLISFENAALPSKGSIVSGPFGSNIGSRFFVADGVPVIRGNNLSLGVSKFKDEGFVYLTDEKAAEFKNCQAIADDLIFTAAGTIGQVAIIPQTSKYPVYIISNKQLRVRCDKSKYFPEFLYYWFIQDSVRQTIINKNTGSTIPLINLGILRNLKIPETALSIQKRIASILSAYDDLIENNQRRIELLETSAHLIYKEWFVKLNFPGREHTKIVDGVPEGWSKKVVPEIIEINPSTKVQKDNENWYVDMACLPTDSMVISGYIKKMGNSGSKFQNNDVLFARITPCLENGKTGFVNFMNPGETGFGSTEFIVLRGEKVPSEFVYCLSRTYNFREKAIKSMIGASGRQRVQVSCFNDFPILLPPRGILTAFKEIVSPCFDQVRNLMFQNQKLKQTRQLLLPKLMSGEIPV